MVASPFLTSYPTVHTCFNKASFQIRAQKEII